MMHQRIMCSLSNKPTFIDFISYLLSVFRKLKASVWVKKAWKECLVAIKKCKFSQNSRLWIYKIEFINLFSDQTQNLRSLSFSSFHFQAFPAFFLTQIKQFQVKSFEKNIAHEDTNHLKNELKSKDHFCTIRLLFTQKKNNKCACLLELLIKSLKDEQF